MKKIYLLFLFVISFISYANAASVYEKNGSVYYVGDDKNVKQLTISDCDRSPVLNPKGEWVYFIHSYEGKWVGEKFYPPKGVKVAPGVLKEEFWRIKIDGTGAIRVFRCEYTNQDGPDENYSPADISNIQFSPNGNKVYFETPEWTTSNGLRVMDADGSHQKLLGAGNSTKIILSSSMTNEKNKSYRGYIVTSQHRYFVFGGSYDWFYLFTPDFKEVGPLGDDWKNSVSDAGIVFTDHSVK